MPIVQPLDADHDHEVAALSEFFKETLGFTPHSVLTMQHRPAIARAFIQLNKAVMENHGRVSSELKRLIGHLSSLTAGCAYCQAHTIRAAARYGASAERLENIWNFRHHPAFTDAERAAFELAVAASCVPNAVDDGVVQTLKKYWTDGEIVEIMGVIALFGFLNRWNDSMGTVLEPPALADGDRWLKQRGWGGGKHV